jgi:hypothetical protein
MTWKTLEVIFERCQAVIYCLSVLARVDLKELDLGELKLRYEKSLEALRKGK